MRIGVTWRRLGGWTLIRFTAFGYQLRISLWRRGARSGLFLGGARGSNSEALADRDGQPHVTTVAPTAAAPRPVSTSRSGYRLRAL